MAFFRALTLTLASAALVTLSSCGGDRGASQNGAAAGADTSAPSTATAPATPAPAEPAAAVRDFVFHGTPKAIDTAAGTVTIDHEKIGDYMEATTSAFKVSDPAILSQVKVGHETHFTLRVAGDRALVVRVHEGHDKGEEH